jgi:hypothetical protein
MPVLRAGPIGGLILWSLLSACTCTIECESKEGPDPGRLALLEEIQEVCKRRYDLTVEMHRSGKASEDDIGRAKIEWLRAQLDVLDARRGR